jgi:hypothetical protein
MAGGVKPVAEVDDRSREEDKHVSVARACDW